MAKGYPLWKYYPARERPPEWVGGVVQAFASSVNELDSRQGLQMTSDKPLGELRPALVALGFDIEGGKKAADKLRRPVLFESKAVRNGHTRWTDSTPKRGSRWRSRRAEERRGTPFIGISSRRAF